MTNLPAGPRSGGKPTPDDLGIDLATLSWERSGAGDGSIEIAFPAGPRWARGDWVLMRVAGDAAGRVLVFDRNEWECFIAGARNGEFDDAAGSGPAVALTDARRAMPRGPSPRPCCPPSR